MGWPRFLRMRSRDAKRYRDRCGFKISACGMCALLSCVGDGKAEADAMRDGVGEDVAKADVGVHSSMIERLRDPSSQKRDVGTQRLLWEKFACKGGRSVR